MILSVLGVGLFSPLSIACWISLLPSFFWNKIFQSKVSNEIIDTNKFITPALVLAIAITLSNLISLFKYKEPKYQKVLTDIGLSQKWFMFSGPTYTSNQDDWVLSKVDFFNEALKPWDPINKKEFEFQFPKTFSYFSTGYMDYIHVHILIENSRHENHREILAQMYIKHYCRETVGAKKMSLYLISKNIYERENKLTLIKEADCSF